MRFRLAKDVLDDSCQERHLDDILSTADQGWHEWEIDNPDELENSKWFKEGRRYVHDLFEKSLTRAAHGYKKNSAWTISNQPCPDALPPRAAAVYFKKPLSICVENESSDGLFVGVVLDALAPEELRNFFKNCESPPMQYKHGGGIDSLRTSIESSINEANQQGIPFRAVVVVDSDKRFPGDEDINQKKPLDIQALCTMHGIPCMVLCKRAIENYIPDSLLKGWSKESASQPAADFVSAICRLTPKQRDHVPMKKKFPDDSSMLPEEAALYESVSFEDRTALKSTELDPDLSRREIINLFKKYKQYVDIDDLRRRDGIEELDRLVDMIAAKL